MGCCSRLVRVKIGLMWGGGRKDRSDTFGKSSLNVNYIEIFCWLEKDTYLCSRKNVNGYANNINREQAE